MIGIILSELINTVFLAQIIKEQENFKDILVNNFLYLVPVYIISIIFAFSNLSLLNSFGMTLTWGAILIYLYNLILTKPLEEILKEGKNEKN